MKHFAGRDRAAVLRRPTSACVVLLDGDARMIRWGGPLRHRMPPVPSVVILLLANKISAKITLCLVMNEVQVPYHTISVIVLFQTTLAREFGFPLCNKLLFCMNLAWI